TAPPTAAGRRRLSALAPVAVEVAPELITIRRWRRRISSREATRPSVRHQWGASIDTSTFDDGAFCNPIRAAGYTAGPYNSDSPPTATYNVSWSPSTRPAFTSAR